MKRDSKLIPDIQGDIEPSTTDSAEQCRKLQAAKHSYNFFAVATWHHPIVAPSLITKALAGHSQKEIAAKLGISPQYLSDIINLRRNLSPEVAAKLHLIGLDGLDLFLGQAIHQYLCAAYHNPNGDPLGAKHFEPEKSAKVSGAVTPGASTEARGGAK